MDAALLMGIGAAIACGVMCLGFAARHGWVWVQDKLEESARMAEADFKARVQAAVKDVSPPLQAAVGQAEQRLKAALDAELAQIKTDIAALKSKVIL